MKSILIFAIFSLTMLFSNSQPVKNAASCNLDVTINHSFSKAAVLDSLLKRYSMNGLPGATLAVFTEAEGWWAGAQGYARLENKTPMENCHLQYIQSVSKTYLAVAILQLKEKGKIDFEAPITKYLPLQYSRYIKNAESVTVRMLLNQTSGVPEYNSHPAFVSQVLMNPEKYFTANDCLKSIAAEELQFAPGSKYKYTNTNYLLLSLIADVITGDHAAFIKKNIFDPLHLKNTFYANNHSYLDGLNLPSSYWDVLNASRPADFSKLQQVTVASSKGDDGIVCTPVDAVKFLKGLMDGKLINAASMQEMQDFVKDEKGNKRYGMGLFYFDLGGIPAYGHGGGGVGAGCGLIYIPSHKTYLFMATNIGVLVDGTLSKKADDLKTEILTTVLQ
jgi:D-alanyl-D-alanine carboxypeptidase